MVFVYLNFLLSNNVYNNTVGFLLDSHKRKRANKFGKRGENIYLISGYDLLKTNGDSWRIIYE